MVRDLWMLQEHTHCLDDGICKKKVTFWTTSICLLLIYSIFTNVRELFTSIIYTDQELSSPSTEIIFVVYYVSYIKMNWCTKGENK